MKTYKECRDRYIEKFGSEPTFKGGPLILAFREKCITEAEFLKMLETTPSEPGPTAEATRRFLERNISGGSNRRT